MVNKLNLITEILNRKSQILRANKGFRDPEVIQLREELYRLRDKNSTGKDLILHLFAQDLLAEIREAGC